MKLHEMRELNADDLKNQISDARKEIVSLRFQLGAFKLENPAKIRVVRKRLSRLLTIQTEQERGLTNGKQEKGKTAKAPAQAKAAKPAAKAASKSKAEAEA